MAEPTPSQQRLDSIADKAVDMLAARYDANHIIRRDRKPLPADQYVRQMKDEIHRHTPYWCYPDENAARIVGDMVNGLDDRYAFINDSKLDGYDNAISLILIGNEKQLMGCQ